MQLGPLAGIHVGSLDGSEPKRLASADTTAVYDPQSGHLLFVRQGTLLAQPFDARALTLTGELPRLQSTVSNDGILAYGVGPGTTAGLQITCTIGRESKWNPWER